MTSGSCRSVHYPSRLTTLILSCIRSEICRCVTPKRVAVCAWCILGRIWWFFSAVCRTERSVMFSALSAVSSIASQTLINRWLLIERAPTISRDTVCQPCSDQLCCFLGLLLHAITHVASVKWGGVDDLKRSGCILGSNLLHTLFHGVA